MNWIKNFIKIHIYFIKSLKPTELLALLGYILVCASFGFFTSKLLN